MAKAKFPVQRMVLATHAKEGSGRCQPQGWPNKTRMSSADAWYIFPMIEFIVQLQWLHTSIYHITFVPVTCGMKGIRSNILFMTQTCSSGWMVALIHLIYNPYTLLFYGLTKYCCNILQVLSLFTTENQRWKSWPRKQWNINKTHL